MTIQFIFSIIVLLVNFIIGLIVLTRRRKNVIAKLFLLIIFSIILWMVSNLFLDFIRNQFFVLLAAKGAYIGAVLIASSFLYFVLVFPKEEYQISKKIKIFILLCTLIFILFSITNFLVKRVEISSYGINIVPGLLYPFFILYFVGFMSIALLILIKKLYTEKGVERLQVLYLFIGVMLATIGGSLTNLIIPYFTGDFSISTYGPLFVIFFVGFTAFAILKHHLFNIKTIATELLTFAIWIAVLFELLIADTWKERIFEGGLLLFVIVFGILLIKSVLKEVHQREQMEKLSKELEKLNSQLSVRTQQLTSLKDFTTSLIKTLDFRKIIQIIVDGIVERFNYAGVFLTGITDDGKYLYPLAISQNKPVELALKLLPKKLEEYREEIENNPSLASQAIQTNSIQINEDFGKFFSAVPLIMLRGIQSLIGFKTALAIPVISKGKVLGVLNVALLKGEKEIGIAELELLNTIANQIAIVLTNAKLFQQVEEVNAKLIELDKAKAGMYSFVSHQIKAPIGIIKGFAQLLLDDSYGKLPKKAKERVEDIKKSCDRLIQLVNDFLDLRRIEEGRMEYEFKEINLVDLVKSVFEELNFLASQKKLEFTLECAEKEIKIKADEQRMRQVIQNLIENSIKYTEKGFVSVKCQMLNVKSQNQNEVLITVSDSGMGIKPDVLPQLFDQFKRAKEAKLIQGTGLGLYIAREIVKAHKGDIWAESEGEGKGSRFVVRLSMDYVLGKDIWRIS